MCVVRTHLNLIPTKSYPYLLKPLRVAKSGVRPRDLHPLDSFGRACRARAAALFCAARCPRGASIALLRRSPAASSAAQWSTAKRTARSRCAPRPTDPTSTFNSGAWASVASGLPSHSLSRRVAGHAPTHTAHGPTAPPLLCSPRSHHQRPASTSPAYWLPRRQVIKLLRSAPVDGTKPNEMRPLTYAVRLGRPRAVEALLKAPPHPMASWVGSAPPRAQGGQPTYHLLSQPTVHLDRVSAHLQLAARPAPPPLPNPHNHKCDPLTRVGRRVPTHCTHTTARTRP